MGRPAGPASASALTRPLSLPAGWNLVSVPLLPLDPAPEAVFGGLAPLRLYDYAAGQVIGMGEPGLRNPGPGRAQWLLLPAATSFAIEGQPITGNARLTIVPGWNAIGDPYLSNLEWSDARVSVSNGPQTVPLTEALAQGWIEELELPNLAGGAVPVGVGSELEPWQGYLLFSTISGSLLLTAPPPDTKAPTVSFDQSVLDVTAPTEISGTVDDDNLAEWRLEFAPTDTGAYTVLATGTSPVLHAALGSIDPTLMMNGLFDVRLVATDLSGNSAAATIPMIVKGNMKIGNFTLTFVDMEVPVAGIPITVKRVYDSRDTSLGDFGHGWRLDVSNVRAQRNGTPGVGWTITATPWLGGTQYCANPSRAHLVTITMPNGRVFEFEPVLDAPCTINSSVIYTNLRYRPRSGSVGSLVPWGLLGGRMDVMVQGNEVYEYPMGGDPLIYDPAGYVLTLPDGRVFDISRTNGLQSITDLNGNRLTYGPAGIVHSSGVGLGFARDGLGRITAVTAPDGTSTGYTYDSGTGNLVTSRDPEGNETSYGYDTTFIHYLAHIEDPLGRMPIRNTYGADGRLESSTDAAGNTITYDHSRMSSRQEVVVDRLQGQRLLEYDDRGNVVFETDAEGGAVTRTFDSRDNRLTEVNSFGEKTTYTYDGSNNPTSVEDPLHNKRTYTYNGSQRVKTTTDARGSVTTNTYDGTDGNGPNLLQTVDAEGNVTRFTYDAQGNLLTKTVTIEGVDFVTRYAYDGAANLVKETDALGNETSYTYDANGRRLSEAKRRTVNGTVETLITRFRYDKVGRLLETTDPDGSKTSTVYDEAGQRITTIDKLGRPTSYTYDECGRLLTTTYPDGTSESSGYDAEGRRITSTDRGGHVTSYTYDRVGRLKTTTAPDGGTLTNVYGEVGRLASVTDARGGKTEYTYDGAGRRKTVKDALGNVTTFGYDAAGNQTSIQDPRGYVTTYVYDKLNRRVTTNFPDAGSGVTTSQTVYDEHGRRKAEIDQAGVTTQFGYDALGRLIWVKDALNRTTNYGYDELGNRVRQTDANGHTTVFTFDALGRETSRALPDGATETKVYDLAGNLERRTDFMGRTTLYTYDTGNRLLTKTYQDGSAVAFSYTPDGRRKTAVDARGTTSYGYDVVDRLTNLTYPDGRSLSYGYDRSGNRTGLTALVGTTLATSYEYDADNRLATVRDPLGRPYSIGYDPNGNRLSLGQPNGVTTSYGYDALNRLTSLVTAGPQGMVQSYAFMLGSTGNRQRITEADGTVKQYGYDLLYRLTSESVTGPTVNYTKGFTYDPVGNRLTQTTSGSGAAGTPTAPGTIAYAYDSRDRLLSEVTSYGYDANGNLTSKTGEAVYSWDFENRLVGVQKTDGTLVQHVYDVDGNRVQTTTVAPGQPPATVNYLVDTSGGLSQVVAETAPASLSAYYVRGGDDLLAVMHPGGTAFYAADGIGSVRALTDGIGHVADTYSYTAFGELIAHVGSDTQPYAFAGEPLDPNAGWQYHRARWMDPRVGRFAGMDGYPALADDPVSLHRYVYVGGSPVDAIDPSGRIRIPNYFWALVGIKAHQVLSLYYAALGGIINTSIDDDNKLRPDIRFAQNAHVPFSTTEIPTTAGEVYEIKPESEEFNGAAQLYEYIVHLQVSEPSVPWHEGIVLGTDQRWPGIMVAPPTFEAYFVDTTLFSNFRGGGVITYYIEDPNQKLKIGVALAAIIALVAAATGGAGAPALAQTLGTAGGIGLSLGF